MCLKMVGVVDILQPAQDSQGGEGQAGGLDFIAYQRFID